MGALSVLVAFVISDRASDGELWCFPCSWPVHAIEQTFGLPVISDGMTRTWRHCYYALIFPELSRAIYPIVRPWRQDTGPLMFKPIMWLCIIIFVTKCAQAIKDGNSKIRWTRDTHCKKGLWSKCEPILYQYYFISIIHYINIIS